MNKSKPGSSGSNKNAILILLLLTSSIFHLLIKQKPDVKVKIIPLELFFFIGNSVKHLQHPTPRHNINVCSRSVFLSPPQLIYRNSNSYYRLLLLLSGGLNPGPFHNLQPLGHDERNIFKHRGFHFLHLSINSFFLKIDELRHIARLTNAAVIEISESKLDDSVSTSEIQIDKYELVRCDRKQKYTWRRRGRGSLLYQKWS